MTYVKSELKTKATAELQKKVDEELNIPDPPKDTAKAALEKNAVEEKEEDETT